MDPPLICFIKLQTEIINSFLGVFGEKTQFAYRLLDFFEKKIRGCPEKTLTLQLRGSFPSNMDQYILEHFCAKFCDFSTM